MTYSGPGHLLHNRQKLSQSFKSSRAPLMNGPVPFAGTINLNSRIIPPTPFVRHFFGVQDVLWTRIQATKAGVNSAPMIFSPAPTAESVRGLYVHRHCAARFIVSLVKRAIKHVRYSRLNSGGALLNMNSTGGAQ